MEIKGLVGRKKDIFEYVFKKFEHFYTITANEDEMTYDIHFRSSAKYELKFDKEIEEVRITIENFTVILDTSEFLSIKIM